MRRKKETPEEVVEVKKYIVQEKFRNQPRAYRLNAKWVGVGGPILRRGTPPQKNQAIPEATDKQYLEIAKLNSYLVQLV